MAEVRQRIPKSPTEKDAGAGVDAETTTKSSSPAERIEAEDGTNPFSLIEVARMFALLFALSCALSYFVTKEDLFWGHRPAYVKLRFWRDLFHRPLYLTPAELARYDGTDPATPIYLAINGTIYDVSAGARHYGPGGSYHSFAGADATRAFVTGCFADDVTPDLRGAELAFVPTDDAAIDALWPPAQLKALKEQERRLARDEVESSVKKWADFFRESDKYHFVGYVVRPEPTGAPPELCKVASDGRPKRRRPDEKPKGVPRV